jgi:hypothetical protein
MKEVEKPEMFTCRIDARQKMLLDEIGTHYGCPTSIVARVAFNWFIDRLTDEQGFIIDTDLSTPPKEEKREAVVQTTPATPKKRKKDKGEWKRYQLCLFKDWSYGEAN